jgi:hypothetical protein
MRNLNHSLIYIISQEIFKKVDPLLVFSKRENLIDYKRSGNQRFKLELRENIKNSLKRK